MSQLTARNTPRLIGAKVDLSQIGQPPAQPAGGEEAPDRENGSVALRLDALLFGETQHRVVLTCTELDATKIIERAKLMGTPAIRIGTVGGETLSVKTPDGERSAPVSTLHDGWWNSIARAMT